jgi:exosome complex component MTR3
MEEDYSLKLQKALEPAVILSLYPKTVIEVFVIVLENDGSCLSNAITAASLALIDAGIEMRDTVVSCSASFMDGNKIMMDCTFNESSKSNGDMLLAYMPALDQINLVSYAGHVDYHLASEAIQWCIDGCSQIQEAVKQSLMN